MKLPTLFTKDYLDGKVDQLLIKPRSTWEGTEILLESCELFLQKQKSHSLEGSYLTGMKIAEGIMYNKHSLEELSKKLPILEENEEMELGIYLSALANKIIKRNEEITLHLKKNFSWIGFRLPKGSLTIIGNTNNYTGAYMKKGKLTVKGDAGEKTGYGMEDGKILVYGKVKGISETCQGKIYENDRLIWPKNS